MQVLHIMGQYGETNVYKELVVHMAKNDIQQNIYIPIRNKNKIKNVLNIPNVNQVFSLSYNKIDRMMFYPRMKKCFKDIEDKFDIKKIDIVHAHTLFADGYLAYKIKEKYNIGYIVSVRTTDSEDYFKKMPHVTLQYYNILNNAKKIICLSHSILKDMYRKANKKTKKILDEKAIVIPNGINDYWQNNMNMPKTINGGVLNLIQVSTFLKRKNIDKSIRLVKELKNRGINTTLKVVGQPINLNKYIKLCKRLGINEYVDFKGFKEKEELINLYRESDVFILPSYNETFGLTYIEAMTQGLPIIFKLGTGIDGYFTKSTIGFGINKFDYEEIYNNIINVLKYYENISSNCLKESKNFNWDSIINNILKLYQ